MTTTAIAAMSRALRQGHLFRVALAVLVLTALLGTAAALQPSSAVGVEPATAAPAVSTPPVSATAVSTPAFTRGRPPVARGETVRCGRPGGPRDCGRGAAGDVKVSAGTPLADGCGVLDALCGGVVPGVPGLPGLPSVVDLFGGGIPGVDDIPNPFGELGDVIAKAAADAWTAAMLAVWSSGLFVLRIVLTFSELFLTPDLRADGPGRDVYAFALWLALAVGVVLVMIQLGAAAFKREGKGLARALIGAGQFVVINACWIGYAVTLIAACGAITRALMRSLLKVQTWPDWDPLGGLGVDDITDAGVATALAFLGIFLWLAAIGHLLVYLARAASLLVLTATGPLAAAGLVSDFTRSWFWKSLRWLHAAAFTPVLMIMVLGIGVQFANGVAAHLAEDTAKTFGTALPAVMTILVSVVAPLSLFKLLAFVDPGTPSGASFRQGMAIEGGIQGLLGNGARSGSSAASSTDTNGRSSGEQSAETSTADRFNKSTQGLLATFGGGAGRALAVGLGAVSSAGAKATSMMSDETNQAGVGHNTYGPDFSGMGGRRSGGRQYGGEPERGGNQMDPPGGDQNEADSWPPSLPTPPAPRTPPTPAGGGPGGGPGGAGSAPISPVPGGGGAAGGAAGAAGGIPPVAV